ncbi:HXXEE domain-containing protein [Fructobacillus sp. M1-13]|uniref:HXXEE domain-containing protein n=1 Tax=Fructobacillus papyriferae TaxID=2713171 RepID=A0ABS5QQK2_9LACO|nr:HXXEE domain-containing protein [Fructobacillus papyriferae]MBS9334619.1 HXXEE domain-containing protein [Fructobacillus papyriferae]MCD2158609.1 HXXEE domain-containing protein [Fructobacillus papyriferae]
MRWYDYMPYVAGLYALLLGCFDWTFQERILLMSLIVIHLHFFEEFGLPGGFAWGGIKVEMGKPDLDVTKWPLNQLSSVFGNLWFALSVYLLPLFTQNWHWTVLAAVIFAFAELIIHLFAFNIGLKSWYNAGLFTAVFGLAPISLTYLLYALPKGLYSWIDLILAVLWIAFNYWIAFRSPIWRALNQHSKYRFTKNDIQKSENYMKKFGDSPENYINMQED